MAPFAHLAVGVGVGAAYWQMLACSTALALLVAALVAYCTTEAGARTLRIRLRPRRPRSFDIMPIDILSLGFLVAFTLPSFEGRRRLGWLH